MTASETTHLGLRDAADQLGVHYMTMYRYVRTGRVPAQRTGAAWSVAVTDLEGFRESNVTPAETGTSHDRSHRLLHRMTDGDEPGAWAIIEETLAAGTTSAVIYGDLLIPALRAIGDEWQQGRLSIAAEHRASAVALRIIGRLGPLFARRGLSRGTVVLGAPEGDAHSLPSAIVADLLRGRGFGVLDLGANTPAESFVESARSANRLIAVLAGTSSQHSVAALADVARELRNAEVGAPLFFGGGAVVSELSARELGADGWTGAHITAVIDAMERVAQAR